MGNRKRLYGAVSLSGLFRMTLPYLNHTTFLLSVKRIVEKTGKIISADSVQELTVGL